MTDDTHSVDEPQDDEVIPNPNYVHGEWMSSEPCCNKENRNMNGWCTSCGCPCL
jgi:hypothetical protein